MIKRSAFSPTSAFVVGHFVHEVEYRADGFLVSSVETRESVPLCIQLNNSFYLGYHVLAFSKVSDLSQLIDGLNFLLLQEKNRDRIFDEHVAVMTSSRNKLLAELFNDPDAPGWFSIRVLPAFLLPISLLEQITFSKCDKVTLLASYMLIRHSPILGFKSAPTRTS